MAGVSSTAILSAVRCALNGRTAYIAEHVRTLAPIETATVLYRLKRLEAAGKVERVPERGRNGNGYMWRLTEAGREELGEIR
ncbi:hypothetical protein [Ensifer sp. LCM 4579]|uniref:hypothetical protein n=1 Tax=Ensifer sp. LCM 4579 TaxID=1848292 RepID=UPI0008DB2EB7|nr:hypothetical protein [Ensifer sp. LCM 4579]OHV85792.1 hypothetical protein LCM4579_00015 [Ensifer sp. LCM 4579]